MIIIREIFTAKPGMASKLAALLRDAMQGIGGVRVLTDAVGEFNTVAVETEVASLAAFEERMRGYAQDTSIRQKMFGYTEMYLTGRREIFRVVT